MKRSSKLHVLLSWILICLSTNSLAHYCPQLNKTDRQVLDATMKAIEIERRELPYAVDYIFKAPSNAGDKEIKAVFFRFGFGAHPEGTVKLQYKVFDSDRIEFRVDSLSNGFRGCIDIVYGGVCGITPQIVVTSENSYLNSKLHNTVYCGFEPRDIINGVSTLSISK